jgi:hypothetical protein
MHKDKGIYLFNDEINNWQEWSGVFQSISSFSSLIEFIFTKENLPFTEKSNDFGKKVFVHGDLCGDNIL